MAKSRKITETEKILDKYACQYRDSYIIARMMLLQVMSMGTGATLHRETTIRKACEKNHENDRKEWTDENGVTHFSMSLTSAELDTDIILCAQEIIKGLNNQTISYADYFKCCSEFFPTR